MYSWDDDTSSWYGKAKYRFGETGKDDREAAAARAAAAGPRTYGGHGPNEQLVDPKKKIKTDTKNPLVVAVDVTGSMSHWPAEIFDRLPLLFNTLSQYRPDLEVSFAAIGDAASDRWPLQVTRFAKGFDLEEQLKAIYGEGGGGDAPESYGLFAYWVNQHVTVPNAKRPFLILFGDATMHPLVPSAQIRGLLADSVQGDADALAEWRKVAQSWDTWFLRRPTGAKGDDVDAQWGKAIGAQQVVWMNDEARAVDYAMGLVARSWGHFGDFKENMKARQDDDKVEELAKRLDGLPRALTCPKCAAALPESEAARLKCPYCGTTVAV